MGLRRSYSSFNDGCAAAHALDLVGDRWTLIIVRELLLGAKRFSDIQRDVIGVGPGILSQRLQHLEARGIVQQRRSAGPGHIDVYELTEWGYQLEAVNTALSLWAVTSPNLPREADMSPDTVVLAMRAHARPAPAYQGERDVTLKLTDSRRRNSEPVTYLARMSPRATIINRSMEPGPTDAEVSATTHDWKACVIGGVPPARLPNVHVSGNDDAVRHLINVTSLTRSPDSTIYADTRVDEDHAELRGP